MIPPELLAQVALEVQVRGVGHVEAAVVAEVRMEGEAQQAALVEVLPQLRNVVAQVEEGLGDQFAVPDDPHAAELLEYEHAVVALGWYHRQGALTPVTKGSA